MNGLQCIIKVTKKRTSLTQKKDQQVIYARFCYKHRPPKEEAKRFRITVGGNIIKYPGEARTKRTDLTTIKMSRQQRRVNKKCKIHDRLLQKLLPQHPN